MTLNEFCKDVFVINLDRRPDRLRKCDEQAQQLGFYFERVSAVDSQSVLNFTNLRPGENALNLSHLSVIQECKNRNLEFATIFEDDFELVPDFENRLISGWPEVPTDWDLVFYGCNFDSLGAGTIPAQKITDNISRVFSVFTTHAMLVKNTVYDFVIEEINKAEAPLDIIYGKVQRQFNAYAYTPPIVKQFDGFSDIIMFDAGYNKRGIFN